MFIRIENVNSCERTPCGFCFVPNCPFFHWYMEIPYHTLGTSIYQIKYIDYSNLPNSTYQYAGLYWQTNNGQTPIGIKNHKENKFI